MNLDDLVFTIIYIGINAGVWVYILKWIKKPQSRTRR
jgi:hypothetical protein